LDCIDSSQLELPLDNPGTSPDFARADLVSASAAGRAVGRSHETVRYWVEHGYVSDYGRGPKRARLVSLSEVEDRAHRLDRAIPAYKAMEVLGIEWAHLVRLCESGELPSWRFGKRTPGLSIVRR